MTAIYDTNLLAGTKARFPVRLQLGNQDPKVPASNKDQEKWKDLDP
jgi:hypothetical protein